MSLNVLNKIFKINSCILKSNKVQKSLFSTSFIKKNMDLKVLVKRLEEYANLKLACDWDNVGLLGN